MPHSAYNEAKYRRDRAALAGAGAACVHCGRPATELDHDPPLVLHAHAAGTGCCRTVPSCASCGRRQGNLLARAGARHHRPPTVTTTPSSPSSSPPRPPGPTAELDAVGYPAGDPIWDTAPWLDDLRTVPADATWPRLMTPPHPDAVGTYAAELVAHAHRQADVDYRWWQRLTAARLLEHDADGILCWDDAGVTVARQVGKSTLLRTLAMHRLDTGGDRWRQPQLILHTGKDLGICVEVQRPARRWAAMPDLDDVYKVRNANGQEQIERLADGSRWLVRAKDNTFGLSATQALVDEAWAVASELIEEGLVPTMVELESPQLLLVSTAHRKATGLMVNRRNTVIGDVASTAGVLWIEWSASPLLADDDEQAWRQASPHWTDRRRRLVAKRYAAALAGEATDDPDELDPLEAFRTQWLNRWPRARRRPGRGEPLLPDKVWDAMAGTIAHPEPGGWIALEENQGAGAAAAVLVADGAGRYEIDGRACDTWGEAIGLAAGFARARPGAQVIVGARLNNQLPDDFPGRTTARRAGTTETGRGLVLLRALVAERRVVHDATADLDDQLARARVYLLASGGLGLVPNGARVDLLRAAVWALDAAQAPAPNPRIY